MSFWSSATFHKDVAWSVAGWLSQLSLERKNLWEILMKKEPTFCTTLKAIAQSLSPACLLTAFLGWGDNSKKINNMETENFLVPLVCLSLPCVKHQRVAETLCLVEWLQRNRRDGCWWWEQRAWTVPATISAENPCARLSKCCLKGMVFYVFNLRRAARQGEHGGSGTPTAWGERWCSESLQVLPLVWGVSVQGGAGRLRLGSPDSTWLVGEARL